MSSLPYPARLTTEEFVRIADAALACGELTREWQIEAINRLGAKISNYTAQPLPVDARVVTPHGSQ